MALSMLDKRLLYELDTNSRQSFTVLAKKFKTSPQRIKYRVDRLVEEGLITSFMTALSTKALGYPLIVKFYIQLSGINKTQEEQIISFLKKDDRVNWLAKTLGEFDLFAAIMVKDFESFAQFKKEFFEKFGSLINNYKTSFIEKAYTLSRGYLINKSSETFNQAKIHQRVDVPLEEIDFAILKLISDNSRLSVVDIAKKTRLDARTIVNKLKNYVNTGIIQTYRINIDRKKLGVNYFKIFIKLKKFDADSLKKLRNYLLTQQYVIHLIENAGEYEFELEIEIPSSAQMQELTKQIRNNYPLIVEKIIATEIIEELKLTWLPKV